MAQKYADKMQPKPDPESFSVSRDSDVAVGPSLHQVGGIESLVERMEECETSRDWSFVLNDHIRWGNNSKVSKHVAIFNMNAAHDCPNRWTDNCQVGGDECYSVKDEKMYPYALDYFRRQEYLWDCLDAVTWVEAFAEILSRKRTEVRAVKFSQSGDFRHDGDIIKVNRIADMLEEYGVKVYTYSASNYLDWSHATSDNLTVNQSNSIEEYGDRRYMAVESESDIPEKATRCPRDEQKSNGLTSDESVRCGECLLCITNASGDIAVVKE